MLIKGINLEDKLNINSKYEDGGLKDKSNKKNENKNFKRQMTVPEQWFETDSINNMLTV